MRLFLVKGSIFAGLLFQLYTSKFQWFLILTYLLNCNRAPCDKNVDYFYPKAPSAIYSLCLVLFYFVKSVSYFNFLEY